jgi:hypothetical protein
VAREMAHVALIARMFVAMPEPLGATLVFEKE